MPRPQPERRAVGLLVTSLPGYNGTPSQTSGHDNQKSFRSLAQTHPDKVISRSARCGVLIVAYGPSTTSQHSSSPHANLCTYLSVSVGPPPTKSGNPSEHLGHPPLDVTSPIDATRPLLSLTCKRAPIRGLLLGGSVLFHEIGLRASSPQFPSHTGRNTQRHDTTHTRCVACVKACTSSRAWTGPA